MCFVTTFPFPFSPFFPWVLYMIQLSFCLGFCFGVGLELVFVFVFVSGSNSFFVF